MFFFLFLVRWNFPSVGLTSNVVSSHAWALPPLPKLGPVSRAVFVSLEGGITLDGEGKLETRISA